jgi:ABC-2 type transport system permease protein
MQIRLSSFIRKEMLHIFRDPRTMLVVLIIPVTLILLFGFTVSTDVNNINIAACAPVRSHAERQSVERLVNSNSFSFTGYISQNEIDRTLRTGIASAVIVFSPDYAVDGEFQIVLDGADVNTARVSESYIRNVLSAASGPELFEMHQIYNPQMKSSFNFIPGIMGMIFLLICAIMTSVSIVKEKETGTMEVLLVSPVKPVYIILSKMIPYLLLSCVDLAIILVLAYYVLEVPLTGGIVNTILLSVLYLILALALGMVVSNVAKSQIVALLISALVMMMPVLFFSGMLFPPENLPWALRWITYVIPARWYIDAMRKLMIEGVGLDGVILEASVLLAETMLLIAAATKRFSDRLE